MITATIYRITHPAKPGDVYIGQTINPAARMRGHVKQARHSRVGLLYNWWRKRERVTRLAPEMTVLESRAFDDLDVARSWLNEREIAYVSLMRSWSAAGWGRSLNATAGGDGASAPSEITRARMAYAASHRSAETRAKIAAAHRGRTLPRDQVEKQRAKMIGRKRPEHAAFMRTAMKERPEWFAALREGANRRMIDPEQRAQAIAALHSPEARAKLARTRQLRAEITAQIRALRAPRVRLAALQSPEARAAWSAKMRTVEVSAVRNAKLRSLESRARARETTLRQFAEKGHPLLGKRMSDETRALMRALMTGKRASDETRAKMSATRKGRPSAIRDREAWLATITGLRRSDEVRARMCLAAQVREQVKRLQRSRLDVLIACARAGRTTDEAREILNWILERSVMPAAEHLVSAAHAVD